MTYEAEYKKKRFGQHFLNNPAIIDRIIKQANPQALDHFIEIGPGPGILTAPLAPKVKQLDVIEIDRDLITTLEIIKTEHPQLIIHNTDILKFDIATINKTAEKFRLIGNLPYNISTPLIFHVLKNIPHIHDMHFMVQKEVADRISAQVGHKNYGRLGIMVQYFCKATLLFNVSPQEFSPPPKVTSAIIRLTPYEKPPFVANDIHLLQDIVREAFNQRRKMLSTSLKHRLCSNDFEQLGIDPKARPETLPIAGFVAMSNFLALKKPDLEK